jgi:polynucleotide 5'-hydroxyl-kinase GRC3/NOL9
MTRPTPNDIHIPPSWLELIQQISHSHGTLMIVGAPDVGKSTLACLLVYHLCQAGRKVVLIDGDLGQNHLGPPTTISMNTFDSFPPHLNEMKPQLMGFVGSTSPSHHLVATIVKIKKILEKSLLYQPEVVIINTDGMVLGNEARTLKSNLISLTNPQAIISLQYSGEIEHLLKPLEKGSTNIYRLPVSEKARKKSPAERRKIREQRFAAYFEDSQSTHISIDQVTICNQGFFFGSGTPLPSGDLTFLSQQLFTRVFYAERSADGLFIIVDGKNSKNNLYLLKEYYTTNWITIRQKQLLVNSLVALNSEDSLTLALAIVEDIDFERNTLHLLSPLLKAKFKEIKKIQWSSLRINSLGKEITEVGTLKQEFPLRRPWKNWGLKMMLS